MLLNIHFEEAEKLSLAALANKFASNDLSFASTETKYIKLKIKIQNNFVIF